MDDSQCVVASTGRRIGCHLDILIVLWWADAMAGMIPNVIIVAVLIRSQRQTG
jgi:hypothetical protein